MAEEVFKGEIDPEIAALLGTTVMPNQSAPIPDFADLFANEAEAKTEESTGASEDHNIVSEGFPEITKNLEEVPHKAFDDPTYYKTAITGEGDISQRVHGILQKYLNAKDPKDKGVFRQQFIPAYWEFLINVGRKATGNLPDPKKYLLRFGLLHPTFLTPEVRTFFSQIVVGNTMNQPVYYLDEWFKAVGTGIIRNSSTDEVRVGKSNKNTQLIQLLEKAQGKLDGSKAILKTKDSQRLALEKDFMARVTQIADHYKMPGLPDVNSCYTDVQKRIIAEVQEQLKMLIKVDRELEISIQDYNQAERDVQSLQAKVQEDGGTVEVDLQAVDTEFETIKQMAKMTIGRQGNHFPLLTCEYYHSMPNDVAYRENIIATLAWIESIDPEAFCRSYKNKLNRIVPYVILIPGYGDTGVCWEPYDRYNRATSRGRIAVPMYPKNLHLAVLSAVGDLRWQVAKEKASYYWMEEGITGNYYQWFQKMKLKGDLKEAFIQDYIAWMVKESEGTQKLDKELRGVFWRFIPFSQPIKEKLKTRSFIYQELYQRDVNRTMSDGY